MNYYNEIKNKLIDNEVYKQVKDYSKNKNDLNTYYEVGRLLIEAQGGKDKAKYGNQLIKDYSKRLTREIGHGYGERNLYNMRSYYLLISENEILQSLPAELTWSHVCELLTLNNNNEILYYANIVHNNHISYRKLKEIIKLKEYERLSDDTKLKLRSNTKLEIQDLVKNPIIIKNPLNIEVITEKVLKQLILEDIPSFLKELGDGFTFIDTEYKIKIGNAYNYIDLLLFNYIYNCFVVVELKVTKLKKEHIGQIQIYMNYINNNLKTIYQNDTIGLIICKKNNKFVIRYSSDSRIFSRSYELR